MTRMMDAAAVREITDQMRRDTKSKTARIAMAKVALSRDNLTDDGRVVWQAFLDEQGQ